MLPDLHTRFCLVAYAPSHDFKTDPLLTPVLLVLQLQEGILQLRTHPSLSEVVLPADLHDVQVLLQDFAERAQDDPESLFRQLSSLSSGPLVTLSVGENPLEDSQVKFLIQRFVVFEA